jgi:hypothetical protein
MRGTASPPAFSNALVQRPSWSWKPRENRSGWLVLNRPHNPITVIWNDIHGRHRRDRSRFPLVARPRPACTRVGRLCSLAETAERDRDPTGASAVCNQAALLSSDARLPDLARRWSHQHAAAYLSAHPLSGQAAHHGPRVRGGAVVG